MNHQTHYFIAVPITSTHKQLIDQWVKQNKEQYPFQSWVHREDYHITLAFLGAVPTNDKLLEVIERVRELTSIMKPFELSLHGFNVFGNKERPRIYWTGVKESSFLKELQRKIFYACLEAGFSLDKKPFQPHITLARKWKSDNPFVLPEWPWFLQAESFIVKQIHLYQTHVDQVPKYEAIRIFPLEGEKNNKL